MVLDVFLEDLVTDGELKNDPDVQVRLKQAESFANAKFLGCPALIRMCGVPPLVSWLSLSASSSTLIERSYF